MVGRVGNDLTLVHEQAILDAGLVYLRERGFGPIVTLGHSGGGTLYAFYLEQAGLAPAERITTTPGGRPANGPEAWLSTWSGLGSNADFVRCAPGVTVPTLFIELTGDQAAFPADSRRMTAGRRRDHRLASQTSRTHPASLSDCHIPSRR